MAESTEQERKQRWTTKRKTALVLSILKGETTAKKAARKHGLTVAEVEDWKDKYKSNLWLDFRGALQTKPKMRRDDGDSAFT